MNEKEEGPLAGLGTGMEPKAPVPLDLGGDGNSTGA